ncbi:dihydrofolate reductase [Bradyrhizobium diazoefficiens]|nr:dihydrofolate reductase [Bradyrhizobium diazoefficiens]MBR0846306.1 dihydrofolate reductase [Bradyrhizobium diazoefficiens]
MEIVLIVAFAENGVIGRDNTIPWRLKADQQRLKALTMNKPLIMGRKTFESLRRPLPGRTNIVITRDPNYRASGAVVTTSVESAFDIARGDALRRSVTEIIIFGGVDVYVRTLPIVDRLEITEVHMRVEGDTRFPAIDTAVWDEVSRIRHPAGPDDSADFSYVTYRRRPRH